MAGEDDNARDASGSPDRPAGPDADATWATLVAPDDIRELARDVAAYHREQRRLRRERRIRLLLRRRGALPLFVLTLASLLAGLVAVLLSVMAPRVVEQPPAALPLAHPAAVTGTVGGLVPGAPLVGPNGPIGSRDATLRPAVFALIPTHCGCADLLNALAGQAFSETLPLAVVIPAASSPATADLVGSLSRGSPGLYYDAAGTLASGVGAQGVTIVVVDRNGTIYQIERSVTDASTSSLDATLQSMLLRSRSH